MRFEVTDRSLLVPCTNAPVDLLLVRPHDIPEYVQDGVVQAGITGANLVVESGADVARAGRARVRTLHARGGGSSRRAPAEPVRSGGAAGCDRVSVLDARAASSASASRSSSSRSRARSRRRRASGLADAIVDLVSTGSTASANGLRRIGRLLESQAVLLANRNAAGDRNPLVERLELMLGAVVAARRLRYVMMNAPAAALDEIRSVLPGMGAPSVLELAEPGQIAVHAAVDVDDVWDLLAPLKAAGASSILVVPVERLVP